MFKFTVCHLHYGLLGLFSTQIIKIVYLSTLVGRDKKETVQHLRQHLSVVLVRDNMNMFASQTLEAAPSEISGQL